MYQGLSDRLQIELSRQVTGLMGWCLTELTDVPQEFNGLLDMYRAEKEPACHELRVATQALLPMLDREHWSAVAGDQFRASLIIDNDGPALARAEVLVTLGGQSCSQALDVAAHGRTRATAGDLTVPADRGTARLYLEVRHGSDVLASNSYPLRVVARRRLRFTVATGDHDLAQLLCACVDGVLEPGEAVPGRHVLVVEERGLVFYASLIPEWLAKGGTVLLLAQAELPGELGALLDLALVDLASGWGSTPFVFTTGSDVLPALPANQLLTSELLSTAPEHVYVRFGPLNSLDQMVVGVLKPAPDPLSGTVVAAQRAQGGRLVACQLPLVQRARSGDSLCAALLEDLLAWAHMADEGRSPDT
jgi:hypothetical protein